MVLRFPERSGATSPERPDEELQREEDEAALRAAIDGLPPRTRLALVLQHDHAMPVSEIAAAMGISVKGVEKLLTAARRKVREVLTGGAAKAPEATR